VRKTISSWYAAVKGWVSEATTGNPNDPLGNNKNSVNKNNSSSKNKITIDDKRTDHIFRNEEGHFKNDTPANRALIEEAANNRNAFQGTDVFGNDRYAQMNQNGTQTWAIVRDGKIINGGINLTP
jgi:hypothetical protein